MSEFEPVVNIVHTARFTNVTRESDDRPLILLETAANDEPSSLAVVDPADYEE